VAVGDNDIRYQQMTSPNFAQYQPKHFQWSLDGKVATVTLNRPERKNPLTFEFCAELRDTFRALARAYRAFAAKERPMFHGD
jgi:enoyl-CoA hydratase/carnithine racemase